MQTIFESPIGVMTLTFDESAVTGLCFGQTAEPDALNETARRALAELDEYFVGRRAEFTVPVNPQGSGFRLAAWRALMGVPYGETAAYGEIARRMGSPLAQRAVGTACRLNPVAIIIPCHRIVKASGKGCENYFGGEWRKTWLLNMESRERGTPPHTRV
jgi:methylated-DNA-[protein]-cysteine S-methyltransferase